MTDNPSGKQRAADALRQMRTPRTGDGNDPDPSDPVGQLRQQIQAAHAKTTDSKEQQ